MNAVRTTVRAGVDPAELTEEDIAAHLYSPLMRDPDSWHPHVGRTADVALPPVAVRLFGTAASPTCLWPDFGKEQLRAGAGRLRGP